MKRFIVNIINQDNGRSFYVINNILSVDFEALDRGSVNDIVDFGIYSNRGSVEFLDADYSFKNIADNGNANLKVEIYYLNGTTKKKKGTFFVDDYEEKNGKVTLSLSDRLTDWQNITIPRIFLFVSTSAKDMLDAILSYTNGITIECDGDTTSTLLEETTCYVPDIKEDSLWDDVVKICQLCQCRVFCNEDGFPVISNGFIKKNRARIKAKNILDIPENYRRSQTRQKDFSLSLHKMRKRNRSILRSIPEVSLYNYTKQATGVAGQYTWTTTEIATNTDEINTLFQDSTTISLARNAIVTVSLPIIDNVYFKKDDATYGKITIKENRTVFKGGANTIQSENEKESYSETSAEFGVQDNNISGKVYIYPALTRQSGQATYFILTDKIDIHGHFYENIGAEIVRGISSTTDGFSLPTNELMQIENFVGDPEFIENGYEMWYIDNIDTKLSKGTECYALTCMVTDYYDENSGDLLYDSSEEMFGKYDAVIPYVMRGSSHVPLSINEMGYPKAFQIVGIKYHFAGIIKQTLYLQEIHTEEL